MPQLPEDIAVVDMHGGGQYDLRLVWRLAALLRQRRPSLVFSVLRYANMVTLLAHLVAQSSAQVVVNEQNLPSAEFQLFGGGLLKAWFLKWLYPRAALVTTISQGISSELTSTFGLSKRKVCVIPNPVDLTRVRALAGAEAEHPWFQSGLPVVLAVGRLHPQKGFDHLLRAFAEIRATLPCKLVILGDGPQRTELERLSAELGINNDVDLPGFQANPYPFMRCAAVFVLSSLYEGLGNVLLEALALGAPVVSTACPVGPDEIITDGVTGLLVPPANDEALAQAIVRLLREPELRRRLSVNGPVRASEFALERIVSQYESLFCELLVPR